jgi:hypothetical protein
VASKKQDMERGKRSMKSKGGYTRQLCAKSAEGVEDKGDKNRSLKESQSNEASLAKCE